MDNEDFGPLWERAQALARTGFYASSGAILAALVFDEGFPEAHAAIRSPIALNALDTLCHQSREPRDTP